MKEIIEWLKFILICFGLLFLSSFVALGWHNILRRSPIVSLISTVIFFGHAGFSIYMYPTDKPLIYYYTTVIGLISFGIMIAKDII